MRIRELAGEIRSLSNNEDAHLMERYDPGMQIMEKIIPNREIRKIGLVSDNQTGELAIEVWEELADRIGKALGRGGQEAINRLSLMSNFKKDSTGITRNNIFKAAHAMGMKLPSHMF